MFHAAVDALTRPEEFFERQPERALAGPATVVLLGAFVRILVGIPIIWMLRFLLPPSKLLLALGAGVVGLLVLDLLRWLVLAAVLHGSATLAGGDGDFRTLFSYLGWTHLPNVVGGVVILLATVGVMTQVNPPTNVEAAGRFAQEFSNGSILEMATAYGTMQAQFGSSLNAIQYAVGVTQLTWNAYLWFAAVRVAGDLDRTRAFAVIALPVAFAGFIVGIPHVDVGLSI